MASRKKGVPAPPQPSSARTLGLPKWRQAKKISLDDIAERTKISLHFLRAIEAEEFDKLPGGIFNTSYLRQYAAAVSFDEPKLLDHYSRSFEGKLTQPEPPKPSRSRSFFDRWLGTSPQAQH